MEINKIKVRKSKRHLKHFQQLFKHLKSLTLENEIVNSEVKYNFKLNATVEN